MLRNSRETAKKIADTLVKEKLAVHTYEVPEIIALPITAGNPAYLAWIDEVTG